MTFIDSHTGGEPTRLILSGAPEGVQFADQYSLDVLRANDGWRRSVMLEPRGSEILVGALLCPARQTRNRFGVLFFNNVGYLGMCGHGLIGVVASLHHRGELQPGRFSVETPVGEVKVRLHEEGTVSFGNVPAYRIAKDVEVRLGDGSRLRGDVAWGGNTFFIVHAPEGTVLELDQTAELTQLALELKQAIHQAGYPEVDHVEISAPSTTVPQPGDRNFVLCPGGAYDRSPCGTGTSARLACLAADGELEEGRIWHQESVAGSRFEGSYRWVKESPGQVIPTLRGQAHVTASGTLVFDPGDPFLQGIPHGAE